MNEDIEAGTAGSLIPFGYYGPPKFKDAETITGGGSANQVNERL